MVWPKAAPARFDLFHELMPIKLVIGISNTKGPFLAPLFFPPGCSWSHGKSGIVIPDICANLAVRSPLCHLHICTNLAGSLLDATCALSQPETNQPLNCLGLNSPPIKPPVSRYTQFQCKPAMTTWTNTTKRLWRRLVSRDFVVTAHNVECLCLMLGPLR